MTIKTQGGKVITKDGKVSCECCEEGECCLYPAQALADGLYTYEDLPDTILYRPPTSPAYPTLNFIELTKEEDPQPSESGNLDMVYYKGSFVAAGGNQSGDTISVEFGFFGTDWAVNILYESLDLEVFLQCLISERFVNKVKDQFADTYIINFPFFDFASQGNVVTRTSLGRWEGTATFFSETFPLILYACLSGLDIIGWAVFVEYTDPGGYALADPHTYDPETNIYISRPNTPVGNYVLIDYDPSFGLVVVS